MTDSAASLRRLRKNLLLSGTTAEHSGDAEAAPATAACASPRRRAPRFGAKKTEQCGKTQNARTCAPLLPALYLPKNFLKVTVP